MLRVWITYVQGGLVNGDEKSLRRLVLVMIFKLGENKDGAEGETRTLTPYGTRT